MKIESLDARKSRVAGDLTRAKMARNRVGRILEQAKAEFLKEYQEELADDPKRIWRNL